MIFFSNRLKLKNTSNGLLTVITCIVFTCCVSGQLPIEPKHIEVIGYKMQMYDTIGNQFSKPTITLREKYWYKDSFAIEEVRKIKITETANTTTQTSPILCYRFNDLRQRTVYEYLNFTDTAKVIRKYSLNDTSVKIIGGWNFGMKRKLEYLGPIEYLNDTIVDGVNYKRVRLSMKIRSRFFMDCYFRCDIKGTVFTHDPYLSEMMGCPLVKIFTFSPIKKDIPTSGEINILSNKLNAQELKVFAAWEKNAKLNPLK